MEEDGTSIICPNRFIVRNLFFSCSPSSGSAIPQSLIFAKIRLHIFHSPEYCRPPSIKACSSVSVNGRYCRRHFQCAKCFSNQLNSTQRARFFRMTLHPEHQRRDYVDSISVERQQFEFHYTNTNNPMLCQSFLTIPSSCQTFCLWQKHSWSQRNSIQVVNTNNVRL